MTKKLTFNESIRDIAYNHPNLAKKIYKAYKDKKYILLIRFFNRL